jgi:putative transposase
MSLARRIVPGTTYLITRRCFERRFFIRPSKKVNQILKFCLAMAAARSGMTVHNFDFLSNHYHLVVTDPGGRLPEFMHWLNEYSAKCLNVELEREGLIWEPGSYNAVELVGETTTIKRLVYVFNNPVSSGLVSSLREWPGAHSTPADMSRPAEIVARPTGFFREHGEVPATVELRVSMPAHLEISIADLERLVEEDAQRLRDAAMAKHRSFLGRDRVMRQCPFDRPRTREDRRGLKPKVASVDKWRRIEALQRLKSFLNAYRGAWERFSAGDRDVLFPYGTYGMRVRFGVQCNAP